MSDLEQHLEDAQQEIERLRAELDRRNQHCQDCPTFIEADQQISTLQAELKQANAVVEAAKKFRDNNDFYNIGPWTDVEIALAKLETGDERTDMAAEDGQREASTREQNGAADQSAIGTVEEAARDAV